MRLCFKLSATDDDDASSSVPPLALPVTYLEFSSAKSISQPPAPLTVFTSKRLFETTRVLSFALGPSHGFAFTQSTLGLITK